MTPYVPNMVKTETIRCYLRCIGLAYFYLQDYPKVIRMNFHTILELRTIGLCTRKIGDILLYTLHSDPRFVRYMILLISHKRISG